MKTALITGASGSIGQAILKKLVQDGWRIIAHRLNKKEKLSFKNTMWVYADLISESGIEEFIEAIEPFYKNTGIDLYIHCAGIQIKGESLPVTDCIKMSMINTIAPYRISEKIVLNMKAGSNMVFISSICADKATKDAEFYGATKAGLNSLVKSLAYKYGQSGVRVNGIEPGIIKSKQTKDAIKDIDFVSKIKGQNPFNKIGTAEDIAALTLLVTGQEARWMTGQVLVADGGSFLGYGETLWEK